MRRARVLLALLAFCSAATGCGPEGEQSELPLRDAFSNPCAWAEADTAVATLDCVGGLYRVVAKEAGRPVAAHRGIKSTSALRVRVGATFEEGPAYLSGNERAGYGIGCWSRIDGDGYVFLVSPAGYAVIGRVKRDRPGFETLAETDEALERPAVPGEAVELGVDCLAPRGAAARLALAVDGRTVLVADDADPPSSFRDLGFYVATTADDAAVSFDDLEADELAGGALEAALAVGEPVIERGTPRVLLRDDFSDPGTGWPDGKARVGTFGYEGGSYRIRLDLDGTIRRGLLVTGSPARAVEVSASGIERDGRPAAAGVGCYRNDEQGYLFVADATGTFSIREEDGSGRFSLLARASGPPLGAGQELKATCAGSPEGATRLTLSVDGRTVVSTLVEDGLTAFRGAALVAGSAEGDSDVRFEDLVVRRL